MKINSWLTDDEIAKSKTITRNNSNRTRRHHYVPQMYLRRWTTESTKTVRFTEISTHVSELKDPDSIAYEENFYQIAADDIDLDAHPDLWFETHMSRIENAAARWLRSLDGLPDGRLTDPNLRANLAVFVALQGLRTPRQRASQLDIGDRIEQYGARTILDNPIALALVCAANGIQYDPSSHNQILETMLASEPISQEAKPVAIDSAIGIWRRAIAPHLTERSWWLVSSTEPLLTCDEPVVLVGKPGQSREYVRRYYTTPLILFPVGPHRLLVLTDSNQPLTRPFSLDATETSAVNLEIAANCFEFVYERADTNIAANISVPDRPETNPTAETFWQEVNTPTRWLGSLSAPEWPLQRWTQEHQR
ncbi:DUF4238 domain-containing protein [Nocardia tengchongensis]|uniref:DUF4238 domain-containing protein n=1 Tax=Nocardia tengchongensis TaxID=2055889 RepID=UPI00364F78C7